MTVFLIIVALYLGYGLGLRHGRRRAITQVATLRVLGRVENARKCTCVRQ